LLDDDPPPRTTPPGSAARDAAAPVRSALLDELERGEDVVLDVGIRLWVFGAESDGVRPTLGAVEDEEDELELLPDELELLPDSPDDELPDEDEPELDPDDVVLPRGTA